MSTAMQKITASLFFALGLASAGAQTNSTEVLGTVTANQVSNGLGFNLDANQDWQFAAAAAAGATHARFDCTWSMVEQQTAPPLNRPADPQYVETSDCLKAFASSAKYGIHPTVVAGFGAPYHAILTVTAPNGAPIGATSVDIEFVSGVGGDTLANIKWPYDYFSAPASVTSTTYGKLSYHGSYEGTFITSVKLKDATHATLTFASATIDPMPADGTQYTINEILYPSAASTDPTDPAVTEYGNYVNFLANDMAAHGLTGDVEIWNEPPWLADPWDDRGDLYDRALWPGNETVGKAGQLFANFGFVANIQNQRFPDGITATWNGTSGNGTSSVLGPSMLGDTGVTFNQPATVVTKESFHPYGITPEESNWTTSCIEAAAAASAYPANNPYHCLLSGEHNSNAIAAVFGDIKAKLINPAYGVGHSVTETGAIPMKAGYKLQQARFVIRQYLAYEADGITPVEFYKLYDAQALPDPAFSFVQQAGKTSFYSANPQFTTLAGFMADINQISSMPVQPYTLADLASVVNYSGTYPLTSAHMVGSRTGAKANSEMFAVWQRSVTPCDATLSQCGDIESWLEQASPAPGPVTVRIPSGMSVTSLMNLTTRIPVSYQSSGATISFQVADDPIGILVDPVADDATSKDTIPTTIVVTGPSGATTYGSPSAFTAILTPETGSASSSNGEAVLFYNNQTLLGTGSLNGGVATLNVSTIPVGTSTVVARFAGDSKLTGSIAFTSTTVTQAAPNLTFAPVAPQSYGVAPIRITATSPSTGGIHYSVASGPGRLAEDKNPGTIVTITGTGTVVLNAAQDAKGNYTAAKTQVSFVVNSASLAFAPIAAQTYGTAPFMVSASSSSKAAIQYSVVSGPARISGTVVTLTGVGTVVLGAKQGATSVRTSFLVNPETTSLALSSIADQSYGSGPITLTATSDSSAAIIYSVVSGPARITGNTLTLTGAGVVVVNASQAATGNYAAASAQVSFTVHSGATSLTLSPIANQTYGSGSIRLSATSNSPAAITYSVVSGPATVAGNVLTPTGSGTIVVGASQSASGNFGAATAQVSFSVASATTSLFLGPIATQTYGNGPVNLAATSNSPATITYAVVSGPATISRSVISINGVGVVVVSATQQSSGSFSGATVTGTFTVLPETPTLSFAPIATQTLGGGTVSIVATSPSSGAISYFVVSGPASIAGNTLTLSAPGVVVVGARQAASGVYAAASQQTSFSVLAEASSTSLNVAPIGAQVYGAVPFNVSATSNSPGAITYKVVSGPGRMRGSSVSLVGIGTVVINVDQAASGKYPAARAQMSFPVNPGALTVNPINTQSVGAGPLILHAISASPAVITFQIVSGPARLSGSSLTVLGSGTVVVGASQPASGSYPAASAQTTFQVVAN